MQPLIDVHQHMVPPAYFAEVEGRMRAVANVTGDAFSWTPEKALAGLDANGVGAAVLSLSAPGVWFGDNAAAARLARVCNEYGAEVAAKYPGRFGFYATLPIPDIDASLEEIAYAFDTLGADGVGLLSSYEDIWLGNPVLEPIMAELNRRKAVVFVHPTVPKASRGLVPGLDDPFLEFLFDSTRTLVHMIATGTLARHTGIRFLFTHAGATTPSVAHRITQGLRLTRGADAPDTMALLRGIYFDVANSAVALNLAGLRQIVDDSHLFFGTDYPYVPVAATVEQLKDSGLGPATAWKGGDARALFPRFAG